MLIFTLNNFTILSDEDTFKNYIKENRNTIEVTVEKENQTANMGMYYFL